MDNSPATRPAAPDGVRRAVAMLTLASLLWGVGFTWAKHVGGALSAAAGMEESAMVGPVVGLTIRFLLAAALWMGVFPSARRGWSIGTLWRGGILGLFLSGGVLTQHLGLARAPAATTAFLTSLTIVIVPVMIALGLRRLPGTRVVIAVALAVVGIWLLTGAKRAAPTVGEFYGIACALFYSVELVLLNVLVPGDDAMRLTPMMFAIAGLAAAGLAAVSPGIETLNLHAVAWPVVGGELALLTVFPTLLAFGLMTFYQPRVTPTRAAITYLLEPVFAAAYAWVAAGEAMTPAALAGAALILAANTAAELGNRPIDPLPPT